MATLTVPHRAIGYKREVKRRGREPGVYAMRPKARYHLMKGDADPSGEGMTVCNLIVWGPDMFGDSHRQLRREDAYDIVEIASIPAERLCKKCLGSLKATD